VCVRPLKGAALATLRTNSLTAIAWCDDSSWNPTRLVQWQQTTPTHLTPSLTCTG